MLTQHDCFDKAMDVAHWQDGLVAQLQKAVDVAHAHGLRQAAGALDHGAEQGLAGHAIDVVQRVAAQVELARALVARPRLLLLDEPAGGLNHEEVSRLGGFIGALRTDFSLSVLLVEHHMGLVMGLADRIHVLDFGRTIAEGTPEEVRTNPAVIEAYLGADTAAA